MTDLLSAAVRFVAVGASAVVLLLSVLLSGARADLAGARAQLAAERAAALKSSELYRQLEKDHRDALAKNNAQAEQKLAAARLDAARASADGSRVRKQLAVYVAAARRSAAADVSAEQECAAAQHALGVLADLFLSADERAGELAAIADDARIRGQSCERAYDSAWAMSQAAAGKPSTLGVLP